MKSVFLVEYGYKYEGGNIASAHKTKEGALKKINSKNMVFDPDTQWVEEGGDGCSRLWIDNYHYVEIREIELEE